MEESQKATEDTQSINEKNQKVTIQVKNAAKILHDETLHFLSALKEAKSFDVKTVSSEISAIAVAVGVADRKVIMETRAMEERLAEEILKVATEYTNFCEGNKDYIKACCEVKSKGIERGLEISIREVEALKTEETRKNSGASKYSVEIEKVLDQFKETIIKKLKNEISQKQVLAETLKKSQAQDKAKEIVYGLRGEGEIVEIRSKLSRIEEDHEKATEIALELIAAIEIELGDSEVYYIERVMSANKEEGTIKRDVEKRKVYNEVLEFDKKMKEKAEKAMAIFSEAEILFEVALKDYTEQLHKAEQKDATLAETLKALEKEKERVELRRKAASNGLKAKVIELRKRMKTKVQLAEQYGTKAGIAKKELAKKSAGDSDEMFDEGDD